MKPSARYLATGAVALAALGLLAGRGWVSEQLPVAAPILVTRSFVEVTDTLRRHETLSDLFARRQIVGGELLGLLQALDGLDPRRVRPATVFEYRVPVGADRPERVRVRVSDHLYVRADRGPDGWTGAREEIAWAIGAERVVGRVRSSLYETIEALIPDTVLPAAGRAQLAWALAEDVFGWQIDFTRDLHPGDEFVVLYERLVSDLGEIRYGRVLAARIETAGRENTAYVLSGKDGANAYYDGEGRSLRRAFKMYPIRFRRISSNFSLSRRHPVLNTTRAHLGTDYAADPGTPIEATADGTVIRAGRWGGYGIMVAIRHAKGIETRYAHLRGLARGIRPGVRVRQGEVIGFVGMTGVANGPHVHYEFLKNGRHLNPRRADLGDGEPVAASRRAAFDSVRAEFDRFLGGPATPTARVD